jgi:hypothetical protein
MSVATFTPLLAEGALARLDLGLAGACDARITGFAGAHVYLAVRDELFAEGRIQPGYLLLDRGGEHLHAVRGEAEHTGPGTAVMQLTDAFSGQRRVFSRAPLVLAATVRSPSGAEWDTVTRDISAGGVALARRPGWDGAPACTLTLRIGAEIAFSAEAEVRRESELTLGMRFTEIAPEHRAMLAELALAYHRA